MAVAWDDSSELRDSLQARCADLESCLVSFQKGFNAVFVLLYKWIVEGHLSCFASSAYFAFEIIASVVSPSNYVPELACLFALFILFTSTPSSSIFTFPFFVTSPVANEFAVSAKRIYPSQRRWKRGCTIDVNIITSDIRALFRWDRVAFCCFALFLTDYKCEFLYLCAATFNWTSLYR